MTPVCLEGLRSSGRYGTQRYRLPDAIVYDLHHATASVATAVYNIIINAACLPNRRWRYRAPSVPVITILLQRRYCGWCGCALSLRL